MISTTNHISQKFDQHLARLYSTLNELSTLTVSAVHDIKSFIDALADTGEPLTDSLKQTEQKISQIFLTETSIDEECERILALYQPVASDLRRVITMIRILGEIQAIANSLQQMLKLLAKFNEGESVEKSMQIIGADKLSYLAEQAGLLVEIAMQLIVKTDTNQSKAILKQYKITKRSYKRLAKLLNKADDQAMGTGKALIHSFRFAQEFLRVITHVKLIISHFIYLNEGRDTRNLSFKQMREIMKLSHGS